MAKLPALERTAWLERARDAKSDEDLLTNLVGAWIAAPAVALCALVEVAGKRAARTPAKDAGWDDVVLGGRLVDFEWMIANLEIRRVDDARDRADLLSKWPLDPRLPGALLRQLAKTGLRGRTSRPFWTIIFRLVHRRFHAGIATAIAAVDEAPIGGDFADYVDMKFQSLRRRIAGHEEPALDAGTQALIAAIREKLEIDQVAAAAKSLEDFLREIWAAPNDDGLREVFADWLMARDDPRGELIMLQMTRKRRGLDLVAQKREAALLKEHAREWMGPLEPAIDKKAYRFEAGFLRAAKVNYRALTLALCTHPAWSTVREYVIDAEVNTFLDHMIALGAKRK